MKSPRDLEAAVEVDGGDEGLEEPGEHRSGVPARPEFCAPGPDERLPDSQPVRDPSKATVRHDRRHVGWSDAFGLVPMALEERLGHDQRKHRIPEGTPAVRRSASRSLGCSLT